MCYSYFTKQKNVCGLEFFVFGVLKINCWLLLWIDITKKRVSYE